MMGNYKGMTDQAIKNQLPSTIQQVSWTKRQAAPESKVGLLILTFYVGNASSLEIELSDQSGKKFGKFKEKISGNFFWTQVKVPAEARQALYATAKLPKHGLEQKSSPLILLPAIEISNAKWDKKEARRGDLLKLTADVKGVPDGTEGLVEIWEHDADGAHDFITKFPVIVKKNKLEADWEYEYREDTDGIPTEEELQKYGNHYNPPEYFFRVKVGEVSMDSGLLEFKDWIEFRLIGMSGRPLTDKKFKLTFADGTTQSGETDDQGRISLKDIKPGKYKIEFADIPPE